MTAVPRPVHDIPSRTPPSPPPPGAAALEAELIAATQQGSVEAFDALVRRYLERAHRVAYRVARHQQDAEDLVQEGFLAALRNIHRFEVGRPFGPWLYRIIINRGLSLHRSRAAHDPESLEVDPPSSRPSPLVHALRGEVRDRFQSVLEALPPRQRLAIELHDLEGFTAEEIGEQLSVAGGTVRWYIHQARKVLRTALAPLAGGEEENDEAQD